MTDSPDPPYVDETREQVVGLAPFTVRRVARWSECDPAGVVYSGNFTEYLLSAAHLFRRRVFGRDWSAMREELQVDLPAKAMSLVFQGSLWPDDAFDMAIRMGEIRTRSFDMLAEAVRSPGGEAVFLGRIASICVSAADRRVSQPLPPELRRRLALEAERSPCPAPLLETRW